MLISIVNHTNGKLSDEKLQEGVRAVNRQIAHDFERGLMSHSSWRCGCWSA